MTNDSKAVQGLNQRVRPRLLDIVRRIRIYALADGVSRLSIVLLCCAMIQLVLDYVFRLPVDMRAVLLLGVIAIAALTLWRSIIQPLLAPIAVSDVAEIIERKFPRLNSLLISAVQFAGGQIGPQHGNSPQLVQRVIAQVESVASDVPMGEVLDHARAKRSSLQFCMVLALWVGFTMLAPEAAGTFFERNVLLGDAAWKQNTNLVVLNDEDSDGIIYAPKGDDLDIRVRATGVVPSRVTIDLEFGGQRDEQQTMTRVGSHEFRIEVPSLTEPLGFSVSGGDARIERVQVLLVPRPRIQSAGVTIYPPAYVDQPAIRLHESKTLIELLPGSDVEILFTPSKPITTATLIRDQVEAGSAVEGEDGYGVRFRPDSDATYSFRLQDEQGLTNSKPRVFVVRLVADQPPRVGLEVEGVGDVVTARVVLPLEMQFRDNYGLDRAELAYQVGDHEGHGQRLEIEEVEQGAKQVLTSRQFAFADISAAEGQRVVLRARAYDLNDIDGPGVGESAEYAYRVVSAEELLAELGRREQEFRQEYEQLMDMQETLREDLLSAADKVLRAPDSEPAAIETSTAARRQRQLARQLAHIHMQFDRIFRELVINQMDSRQVRERLLVGIVQPLDVLGDRTMPLAADGITELREQVGEDGFRRVDAQQAAILAEMHRILANMSKWEGFHETVSLLQAIIKAQRQLEQETQDSMEQQFEEIFGE